MKELFASHRSLSGLSLALLFLVVPVFAQELAASTKTDPAPTELSGTWQVKMALPAGEKPGESGEKIYTLQVEGTEKVAIRSPDQGPLEVTDVLVSGGDLQIYFNYSPVKGEPGNSVELKGSVDEKGNLAGTWQFLVTGQSGKWTAEGDRAAGRPAAGNVALVKAQKDTGAAADDEVAPAEVEKDEETAAADEAAPAEEEKGGVPAGFEAKLDYFFERYGVKPLQSVLFWKPFADVPLIVAWLLFGALFFTLRMKFVNFRLFRHAIDLVRGKYDEPGSVGEVTHFQALSTALSATVGLGNIAGVAIAIGIGGPGATFWMIVIGLLGMTAKFTECTLGQKYRQVRSDGKIMGGAMYYLSDGLKELGLKPLGGVLAILFCVLCIGASFGGGNAFQVVQSLGVIKTVVPKFVEYPWVYGLIMTLLGGVVIIGGIRSIARVAEKIVPLMCGIYVLACLTILFMNFGVIPEAISQIFSGAFDPGPDGTNDPIKGGIIGVLVIGIQRAVFSNEAGVGSAAIAHSAAKVKHPVEEGVVALLEPFIDTVVVCTMTALVIIITGAHIAPENAEIVASNNGGMLTSQAFRSQIEWFPEILAVAVFLFAFSTMISWSYYGERCWAWLFGDGSSMIYRVLFLGFTFLGSIVTATNILEFSDLMILGMALPNILGVLLLSGVVGRDLKEYTGMLKRGELEPGYSADGEEAAAAGETGKKDAGSSEDEAPEA